MCAIALLVLILLIVCFIKRSRGGKYPGELCRGVGLGEGLAGYPVSHQVSGELHPWQAGEYSPIACSLRLRAASKQLELTTLP